MKTLANMASEIVGTLKLTPGVMRRVRTKLAIVVLKGVAMIPLTSVKTTVTEKLTTEVP